MKIKKILSLLLFVGVILTMSFLLYRNQAKVVEADANDNVSGFAWSSNLGWISFNCNNSELAPGCVSSDYGVHITDDPGDNRKGIFSGHAWSSSVGWIDFDEEDLVGCPLGTCRAWVDKKAVAGLAQVYGWAKIRTTNDWVHLWRNDSGISYGVSINKNTGVFSGYGWGGETAGWTSFSCENTGICSPVNYKVKTTFDMNIRPTVSDMVAIRGDMCAIPPTYSFSWKFQDEDDGPPADKQIQYRIQIDSDNNWTNNNVPGEIDLTFPTDIAQDLPQTKAIELAKNPAVGPDGSTQLAYNKTYRWRIKVWDNLGRLSSESAWFEGPVTFKTPTHISPTPSFKWKPETIIKDQQIQFCSVLNGTCLVDLSDCYNNDNDRVTCLGRATFTWTLPPNTSPVGSTVANPIIKFGDSGNTSVSLRIKDNDNVGDCSTPKTFKITLPLPKWRENLPQ